MMRHRYEKRIKELEDKVDKLEYIAALVCPHNHVGFFDNNYGGYYKRCKDCGKRLDSYNTYSEWIKAKAEYTIKEQQALLGGMGEENGASDD